MNAVSVIVVALALGLGALALLPAGILLVQVAAARLSRRQSAGAPGPTTPSPRPPLCVLMPAHNEASGLLATLASVQAQLQAHDQILVVADNCDDATAEIARSAGVHVVERHHAELRGKGHALDHGVRHIDTWVDAPAVVIIVDADCYLGADALDRLARAALTAARPVQALYLMHAPEGSSLKQRVAEFAWVVKNRVRPAGMHQLGLPCQLMGSGMAFPWPLLQAAPLATGHLVEDMKLGTDLAAAGHPPLFCEEALVYSYFPSQADGLQTQRTRWEQGHFSIIADQGLALLGRALWRRDGRLLAMAADVCVPPLASLVLLQSGALALSVATGLAFGAWAACELAAAGLVSVAVAVLLAWGGFGRSVIAPRELLAVPGYVLAKLPIYLSLLRGRQSVWVRTQRDPQAQAKPTKPP